MSDDFFEDEGLLDDDPALDYILYKEMENDHKTSNKSGGCLGLVLLLLLPIAAGTTLLFVR